MSILDAAKAIVHGNREQVYGHPSKNLSCIAGMWEQYLHSRGLLNLDGEGLRPEDVALMMTLLKIARLANNLSHEDSLVDAAGYLALVERCKE